ncbi:uncharacterized protein [Halyomorpha halys]|uniref:uncharacterized protein n=1 Tax=Halyomorpha halys TaxID=286706 RepID=UPI0006D4EC04|nr:uncharacterized protein LOC106689326 [Halyomorpha halys]
MVASNRFILFFIVALIAEGSAIPLAYICQQMVNQFNHLQSLVPVQIDVYFWDSTPFLTGPATFKIGSLVTKSECRAADKTTDNREVVVELTASKGFIISDNNILTIQGINCTTKFDVEHRYQNQKTISVDDLSVKFNSIYESGNKLSPAEQTEIENVLKISLIEIAKMKLKTNFYSSRRKINQDSVYSLMQDVYLVAAQDF